MKLSDKQREQIRSNLIEQLTRLYRGVHEEVRDSMEQPVYTEDQPPDEAEAAANLEVRGARMSLAENDARRAQQIEQALRRLADGSYGECVDCGNPIERERLELVPWASRCIECQTDVERDTQERAPTM